jgi:hypothetical protein
MQLSREQLLAFGQASNCMSLHEVLDFIRAHPRSNDLRKLAAAYGMALQAAKAVRSTAYFEDSRFVVDELARAKAEIDIVGYHYHDIISATAPILSAAQKFLDDETVGCNDWPSPEDIAVVAIRTATAIAAA